MVRFATLSLLLLVGSASFAAEPTPKQVPWLAEVQPRGVASSEPALSPLWPAGQTLTRESWQPQREKLRKAWLAFLGPMPAAPTATSFKVLRTESLDKVDRQLIEYENEPGQHITAYLLRPRGAFFRHSQPALVALHPTTKETIDPIAGVTGEPNKHLGLFLAERGFVVLCPRCFLWQDGATLNDAVAVLKARHPAALGMRKMLYDAQRAVDIVSNVPEVDPLRVGAVGHSLGAKETLYLAAFDDRIRAAVASEGGLGLRSTNWDAPWYLGTAIHEPGFPRNHHELAALIAPRPFLVIGGEQGRGAADGQRSWPYLHAALPIYRLYDDVAPAGLLNHGQGHPLPIALFDRVAEWLTVYLRSPGDGN
ncbi:MAG: acetylxylan esterase [Planctomycetes bacterium]|nr:acetylxylan esterase [Planctomycetota bacterium]